MNKYFVRNSYPRRENVASHTVRLPQARNGEIPVVFDRVEKAPPSAEMGTRTYQCTVDQPPEEEGEEATYEIRVSGSVDDWVSATVDGETQDSGDKHGAGVSFDFVFNISYPGSYCVSITHENADDVDTSGNVSFLNATISGVTLCAQVPDENEDEEECEPCEEGEEDTEDGQCSDCGDEQCEEDGDGEDGGDENADTRQVRGTEWTPVMGNWRSSSGGSGALRQSNASLMKWKATFGRFRGLSGVPVGALELGINHGGYNPTIGRAEGLLWRHPLSAWVALPETGITRNSMFVLRRGIGKVNFLVNGSGKAIFPIGASSKTKVQMHFVRDKELGKGVECSLAEASYLRASYTNGTANFFDLQEGNCVGYISPKQSKIDSEHGLQYAAVIRERKEGEEGSSAIRQVWNTWDGLANVVADEDGNGYHIDIYPPAQVTAPAGEGELFGHKGTPLRVFTVRADDDERSVTVKEKDNTLPESYGEMVTRWIWEHDAWSMIEGEGEDAVETRRERVCDDGKYYSIVTRQLKRGKVASCVRRDFEVDDVFGDLVRRSIQGYGEPGALVTTYEYNTSGKIEQTESARTGVKKILYDAEGRRIMVSSPWGEGKNAQQMTGTTYRGKEATYSSDPASVTKYYYNGEYSVIWNRQAFTYTEQNHVRRVEKDTQEFGWSSEEKKDVPVRHRISVEEKWLASAPNPYAQGRIKMRQEENGTRTVYDYEGTGEYGALYKVIEETRDAEDNPAPGMSTRHVTFISAEGNTLREEDYVLLKDGTWKLINGVSYEYDVLNRRVGTRWDNGRSTSRALTCQGQLLWEIDADGVKTTYAYNSARQLIETTRSETPTTPETITEYERDAAGRVTRETVYTGAQKKETRTEYDLQGRVVRKVDELGRETRTEYSEDGLTVTTTLPSGAKLINVYNTDGSLYKQEGDGQRNLEFRRWPKYELGYAVATHLPDGAFVEMQVTNGYNQVCERSRARVGGGQIYWDAFYNEKGEQVRVKEGTLAPTTWTYDSMGNVASQTLVLDEENPEDATKNQMMRQSQYYELGEDGEVYQTLTQERNNPAGEWLTSMQKVLVSRLSPTIESKQIFIDERGKVTTSWTEYGEGTERISKQTIPTSDITAEVITIDGFTTSETDNTGTTTTHSRKFLENGMRFEDTDGRGNTTTTITDVLNRPLTETNAAGDVTTTIYDPANNNPAVVTDAMGFTSCYSYDPRGRKIAQYGTALQPATLEYDDADHLVKLTTWRDAQQTISSDPTGLEGGDMTRWEFNEPTGLELKKIYADDAEVVKTYDGMNRLATLTNARGELTVYGYEEKRGLLVQVRLKEGDPLQTFFYNILAQYTQVTDAAGTHTFSYDKYGTQSGEEYPVEDVPYHLNEQTDDFGRNIGHTLVRGEEASPLLTATTGYASDGRIGSAGLLDRGVMREFGYTYLKGANLLADLAMPCGLHLLQEYEQKRDLLTKMSYIRNTDGGLVVQRNYTYDKLGRPVTRQTLRSGGAMNETFDYNDRSELIHATRTVGDSFDYAYDNIGNRVTAQEVNSGATSDIAYVTNDLNQYTQIDTNGSDFTPEYDEDGNQTLIQTETGIWRVTYNVQNRAVRFENESDGTVITCDYDYLGRRVFKKVEKNGVATSHEHYLYRGYLQIASLDMMEGQNQALINAYVWDPTQPIATRPLAIFYKGVAYYYGWDLTKNITEIFSLSARLQIDYVYTPFGQVRENGIIPQSIQWSSEYHDAELGLVYYNYRYYNPRDGRWTRRDPLGIQSCVNPYNVVENKLTQTSDYLGLVPTSSLQTPDGTRILLELAIATGSGIIGGVTSKMLENKCDKPNTFSEPVPFEVECTRKCKPKKKSGKTCKDKKGKGERKGRMICRAGLFRNTWKFVKWTEEGHDCNAAKCDSCCKSVKITYASKP